MVDGAIMLDLSYEEDSRAEVDANFAITGSGKLIEVQCTAEHSPFDDQQLRAMLELARAGVLQLVEQQKAILKQQAGT
jgi:ribonuclease PH